MPLIFSYGSLQQPDVQRATFGRLLEGRADQLPGFEPSLVPIEDPIEAAASGRTHHANVVVAGDEAARVAGSVFDISETELAAADEYERSADYVRLAVVLESGTDAWVYVHAPSTPAGN